MNLSEKVKEVNKILEGFGAKAIQVDNSKSFKSIGYRPQYLIDAMNEAFGVGGWFHEVISVAKDELKTANDKTRISISVMMKVTVIDGEKTFTTGQQAGGSFVLSGGYGDAFKSAITDGLGKCLSLLGVGNKAYRGELKPEDAAAVIETDEQDADIAADLGIATASPKPTVTTINTPNVISAQTPAPTTPRFGGFRTKVSTPSNGSAGPPSVPGPNAEAPTARFRTPGLTQKVGA